MITMPQGPTFRAGDGDGDRSPPGSRAGRKRDELGLCGQAPQTTLELIVGVVHPIASSDMSSDRWVRPLASRALIVPVGAPVCSAICSMVMPAR